MNYTLITACLNSIKTIEKTVDSVLFQKILPTQYIFIDGGSNDGTLEYLSSKEEIIKSMGINFLVINQNTKGGIYEAWNLGLKRINESSDYIFILNSDDWYYKHTINYVSDFFYRNQNIDILCGASLNFHENKESNISFNKNSHLFPILMPIIHPACFIRKKVYEKVGFFNDDFRVSGDYDFLFRSYKLDMKFKFSKKLLVKRKMGGFADSNKDLARMETFKIATSHSNFKIIPLISYWIRKVLKR
jgi:glycosyltransferase involved in cell wall biosynthesis